MQLLLDVGQGDIGDANTTAAAMHTLSSISRNLPAGEIFLFGAPQAPGQRTPDPITLVLSIVDRFWPSDALESQYRACRPCRQIMTRGLGFLENLAVNNADVRRHMLGSPAAAAAWIGAFALHNCPLRKSE